MTKRDEVCYVTWVLRGKQEFTPTYLGARGEMPRRYGCVCGAEQTVSTWKDFHRLNVPHDAPKNVKLRLFHWLHTGKVL